METDLFLNLNSNAGGRKKALIGSIGFKLLNIAGNVC